MAPSRAVLLTGASSGTGLSSGTGRATALRLHRAGWPVYATGRSVEALADLAAEGITTLYVDVTEEKSMMAAVERITAEHGAVGVLINNAAYSLNGTIGETPIEEVRRQFETNVFGVLRTIYAALPELEKTRGNLAIIGSVAGWVSSAGASPYSMSKFAVRALANAITQELKPAGVKVTLISPGFVISEIRQVDNQGKLRALSEATKPHPLAMKTEPAVYDMLQAIARGKREAIITLHGKFFVQLDRFFPWVTRAHAERISARRDKT